MADIILSAIDAALSSGAVHKSIEVLRTWLAQAQPGDPEALLSAAPADMRPKLSLLMRDLLSRYPATLLGAPVLLFAQPDSGNKAWSLTLPFPTRESLQPCSDLHFLGWLPLSTQLPIPQPFRPENFTTTVSWGKPACAVALFRSHPGVFDIDSLELPNMWWGELFHHVEARIQLSTRMLLAYPDALEAGRVMEAFANGESTPARGHFLSDTGWSWASDEGVLFHETCRHLSIDEDI